MPTGFGPDYNIGQALAGGAQTQPGISDYIGRAFAPENAGTLATGLNTFAKIAGARPEQTSATDQLIQSIQAAEAAKKQGEERGEKGSLLKDIITRLSGGDPSAANTGGLTDLKIAPGKDGNIVATATGDVTTKDANAGTATATDLIAGGGDSAGTLRDLIPF